MKNKKVSSPGIASTAGKILHDKNSSDTAKSLAASVLSQVNKNNETGKGMEKVASDVLKSNKYSTETKSLAASVVSQSEKAR
jgi:hypothetical protein